MAQVVLPDQSYCISGRLIYDNIILIRDLLEISKLFDFKMGIVSIDQEKAFDRVENTYLLPKIVCIGRLKVCYFCRKMEDKD